jgi:hypothetical protein
MMSRSGFSLTHLNKHRVLQVIVPGAPVVEPALTNRTDPESSHNPSSSGNEIPMNGVLLRQMLTLKDAKGLTGRSANPQPRYTRLC